MARKKLKNNGAVEKKLVGVMDAFAKSFAA